MRIGVLSNLKAGRASVPKLLSFLSAHPEVHHTETESVQALPEALLELVRQEVDLLVVNGGDGTLQHALTELLSNPDIERLPLLAPLRGGRTNMTALDLGGQRNPLRALSDVIASAEAGTIRDRIVERPVVRIETRSGDVRYGMFFGAGLIHRAIALTHRRFPPGRTQGALGAGVVTAQLIAKLGRGGDDDVLTPDKVQVVLDGRTVPHGEFYMVIASTVQRLFLRINPFWGTGPGGLRVSCLASGAVKPRNAAFGILRGKPRPWVRPENGYTSENVEHVRLTLDCGFTIDGEIYEPRPNEVVTLTADRRVTFVRA